MIPSLPRPLSGSGYSVSVHQAASIKLTGGIIENQPFLPDVVIRNRLCEIPAPFGVAMFTTGTHLPLYPFRPRFVG